MGDPSVAQSIALLADSSDLTAVVDLLGRPKYLNLAGQRLLGIPADTELDDINLAAFLPAKALEQVAEDVVPTLERRGVWKGLLTLLSAGGMEMPTRCTIRLHEGSDDTPDHLTWVARDISTEKAVAAQLAKRAFHDDLTGLPHRSLFLDRLHLSLARPSDEPARVAVLFINLDHFKQKNDRFGHDVGDMLLKAVSTRLPSGLDPDDTIARWGGDEFVVLREGLSNDEEGLAMSRAVQAALESPFVVDGQEIFLSASMGLATAFPGECTTDELLRHADAAGQIAKRSGGGGGVQLFDEEMRERALRRAELEDALRRALSAQELEIHYQPEIDLRTMRICAVEALLRWTSRDFGSVSPAEFIPIAESSRLIVDLGAFVMWEAFSQAKRWRDEFPGHNPSVAVNISARQWREDDFVETVRATLSLSGAHVEDIVLEITEGILMENVDSTVATLNRLRDLGIRIAVDDFGTGYSSLSYLREFPVDILKVDQSFVRGLGTDPEDSAIVRAVVHMGKALNLTTIAEGVETDLHVGALQGLQCDIAQGFHFARPTPPQDVADLLEAGDDWHRVRGER